MIVGKEQARISIENVRVEYVTQKPGLQGLQASICCQISTCHLISRSVMPTICDMHDCGIGNKGKQLSQTGQIKVTDSGRCLYVVCGCLELADAL